MKCRYCGNPIEADAKKCPSCLWEGDDLAVEDDAQVKKEEPKEEQEPPKDDLFEQATDANSENNEETTHSEPKEEKAPENVVVGLTKKEFFDFYIPEKIRSNALWASYFLFASAIAFCFTAIFNFYYGVICSVVCLVLAIAIKKTLSIGPAIASCIFTILLTIVNFMLSQRITGWWAIVASIFCCTALNKFNSLWTIYSATSKVPTLDPIDKARSEARKNQKPNKAGWIVYYAALILCIVGVVVHYTFALSYISKFDFGTTEGNSLQTTYIRHR